MIWLLKYSLWSLPLPLSWRAEEHPQDLQWLYLWEEGLTDPAGMFLLRHKTNPRNALKHWLLSLFSSTARALLCWQSWSGAGGWIHPPSGMGEAAPAAPPQELGLEEQGDSHFPHLIMPSLSSTQRAIQQLPPAPCPKLSPRSDSEEQPKPSRLGEKNSPWWYFLGGVED